MTPDNFKKFLELATYKINIEDINERDATSPRVKCEVTKLFLQLATNNKVMTPLPGTILLHE